MPRSPVSSVTRRVVSVAQDQPHQHLRVVRPSGNTPQTPTTKDAVGHDAAMRWHCHSAQASHAMDGPPQVNGPGGRRSSRGLWEVEGLDKGAVAESRP